MKICPGVLKKFQTGSQNFCEISLKDKSTLFRGSCLTNLDFRSGVTQLVLTGLGHLPQGMYFVRITETATGKVTVEKLIKNQ